MCRTVDGCRRYVPCTLHHGTICPEPDHESRRALAPVVVGDLTEGGSLRWTWCALLAQAAPLLVDCSQVVDPRSGLDGAETPDKLLILIPLGRGWSRSAGLLYTRSQDALPKLPPLVNTREKALSPVFSIRSSVSAFLSGSQTACLPSAICCASPRFPAFGPWLPRCRSQRLPQRGLLLRRQFLALGGHVEHVDGLVRLGVDQNHLDVGAVRRNRGGQVVE